MSVREPYSRPSVRNLLRRLLPASVRHSLRRLTLGRAAARGQLGERGDPFFERLGELVRPGDWVIDVGAAVGDYAIPLSRIVGAHGRVIALEPMPVQFDLLTSNARRTPYANITCLQLAAGEKVELLTMQAPVIAGAPDWYEARVALDGDTTVLSVSLDSICIPERVSLVKIDAEGHDLAVLRGATRLIANDRPAILIEADNADVRAWVTPHGYTRESDPNSINTLYLPLT